ncbi:MAG: TetR/AcrR family transcriptional regulator [Promethearchaeota archaeon]
MNQEKKFTRDKDEKIRLVFQAFADLVNEKGYQNINIRDITNRANIGIGTIYRYFPKGKPSIASKFFEHTGEKILDINALKKIGENNLPKIFDLYIRNHLKTHRENYEIHRAYELAILANKELFSNIKTYVDDMFKDILHIYKKEGIFRGVPEDLLLKNNILFFNLIEAVVHRHLFIIPFFDTDEELIEFLKNIIITIIKTQV